MYQIGRTALPPPCIRDEWWCMHNTWFLATSSSLRRNGRGRQRPDQIYVGLWASGLHVASKHQGRLPPTSLQRCDPETTEGLYFSGRNLKVSFELLENWSQKAPWMCSFEDYFQQEENRTLLIAAFEPCQTISSDFLQTLLLLKFFLGSQGGVCLVGERWVGWRTLWWHGQYWTEELRDDYTMLTSSASSFDQWRHWSLK